MGLLRRVPHVPGPPVDDPTVDLTPHRCEACRRTGVPLAPAVLEDRTKTRLCPDPATCRRNWPKEAAR